MSRTQVESNLPRRGHGIPQLLQCLNCKEVDAAIDSDCNGPICTEQNANGFGIVGRMNYRFDGERMRPA